MGHTNSPQRGAVLFPLPVLQHDDGPDSDDHAVNGQHRAGEVSRGPHHQLEGHTYNTRRQQPINATQHQWVRWKYYGRDVTSSCSGRWTRCTERSSRQSTPWGREWGYPTASYSTASTSQVAAWPETCRASGTCIGSSSWRAALITRCHSLFTCDSSEKCSLVLESIVWPPNRFGARRMFDVSFSRTLFENASCSPGYT